MTDLLCFGSCVLDLYADGQKPAVGGDAANQAILLSKLGFSTACSARLGQDQEADLILAQLQAHNVKIDWLRRHAGEITTHSRIQLDAQGERRFTVTGEAHRHFTLADFPMEALPSLRALSLGSLFTLHELEISGMELIFSRARILAFRFTAIRPATGITKGCPAWRICFLTSTFSCPRLRKSVRCAHASSRMKSQKNYSGSA